jgi:peptidoglycan/xylan/chitin deacetylase (PgdA/CDA1 family)
MKARAFVAVMAAILVSSPLLAEEREQDFRQPSATVLCYHIVESPQDERMEISRETFRQHLQYLQMTGYNVIPLRELYEYVAGKRDSIPPNAVVITIDDGWRSAYTEAFPELKERGFPFTLFIYPKIIGKTPIALNWDQVREMANEGVDVQSHTLSHGFLTRARNESMDDAAYAAWLQKELAESKRIIEKETGQKVRFLAYPYGDFNQRVIKATEKAGYDAALTCEYGRVVKGSDPLRMKRVVIDKKMDFAAFRFYMGARQLEVAETTSISARIPKFKSLDPESVGMALLSLPEVRPYAYDANTGAISVAVEEVGELEGKAHRALVWGRDAKTGRRVEASWTFKVPEPAPLPADSTAEKPASRSVGAAAGGR